MMKCMIRAAGTLMVVALCGCGKQSNTGDTPKPSEPPAPPASEVNLGTLEQSLRDVADQHLAIEPLATPEVLLVVKESERTRTLDKLVTTAEALGGHATPGLIDAGRQRVMVALPANEMVKFLAVLDITQEVSDTDQIDVVLRWKVTGK